MKIFRLYRTVRYLKSIQIYRRIWFKCYKPKPVSKPAPDLRNVKNHWKTSIKKPNSFQPPDEFTFLNVSCRHFSPPLIRGGREGFDFEGLNPPQSPLVRGEENGKLWRYNFHYFDYLNAKNAYQHIPLLQQLIESWIAEHPASTGDAWEPYPLSLRIVNWIKFHLSGHALSDRALQSLANQARYLTKRLEYHLLGNHLFANAKALLFAGLFFDGNEAARWFQTACHIFSKQLPEQILADGAHFELSPMYHAIILDDLLDLLNIAQVYEKTLPFNLQSYAEKMLTWLKAMTHPDGEIAFFNDAALGIAPPVAELTQYAKILFSSTDKGRPGGVFPSLSSNAYHRHDTSQYIAIVDTAPIGPDYLPGHAHADTLCFELSVGKQRVIVNSGTSCYEHSDQRLQERSTAAHNTLVLDHQNSSEVWSSFRVGRRAKIIRCEVKDNKIVAAHDGYTHLSGKPVHQRTWQFEENRLMITDQVLGQGQHHVAIYFHFYPDLLLDLRADTLTVNNQQGEQLLRLRGDKKLQATLLNSTFHSAFGLSQKNQVLCLQAHVELPVRFEIVMSM